MKIIRAEELSEFKDMCDTIIADMETSKEDQQTYSLCISGQDKYNDVCSNIRHSISSYIITDKTSAFHIRMKGENDDKTYDLYICVYRAVYDTTYHIVQISNVNMLDR